MCSQSTTLMNFSLSLSLFVNAPCQERTELGAKERMKEKKTRERERERERERVQTRLQEFIRSSRSMQMNNKLRGYRSNIITVIYEHSYANKKNSNHIILSILEFKIPSNILSKKL